MKLLDKNNIDIENGDIIDIHQTVNGYNQFVIFIDEDLEKVVIMYYDKQPIRYYEYDYVNLLELYNYEDKEIEIVGNIFELEGVMLS